MARLAFIKAFYAAHLSYWKHGNGYLTEETMVKMPHGPGIHEGTKFLEQMAADGRLNIELNDQGLYPEFTYTLLGEPPPLTESQDLSVTEAITWVGSRSAGQ